jgi:hypothetical protein
MRAEGSQKLLYMITTRLRWRTKKAQDSYRNKAPCKAIKKKEILTIWQSTILIGQHKGD